MDVLDENIEGATYISAEFTAIEPLTLQYAKKRRLLLTNHSQLIYLIDSRQIKPIHVHLDPCCAANLEFLISGP
jgi:hypothetical protein